MADVQAAGQTPEANRRDFLYIATSAVAGVGAAATLWPFIDQMNPAANVAALATFEVDISLIEEGQTIKVKWQGKPVFIRHRSSSQIDEVRAVALDDLPAPEADEDRVERPEWLVMIGVCTHLGCIPVSDQGDYDGWFCPCHGSQFDGSGRIRQGPAPENLPIPPYSFIEDTKILIG